MAEDYRLPVAPIFVVDLRAVFGCDRGHGMFSFVLDSIGVLWVHWFADILTVLRPRRFLLARGGKYLSVLSIILYLMRWPRAVIDSDCQLIPREIESQADRS